MGDLKGEYISSEVKGLLVGAIDEAIQEYGVSVKYCCQVLKLDCRRYERWNGNYRQTGSYANGKPGPKSAPHRLLAEEQAKIKVLARDDNYADLSHRQLAVVASEEGVVEASASSFYRVMQAENLMEKRRRTPKTPQTKPEVKPERPNQVWSWDLTYIALGPFFVYLFAIIDVYSRKIVGWHLSMNATVASMKLAWDKALSSEGLLGEIGAAPMMPTALSDHGVQMAKKSAKQFFKDLGIKQLFARYQTPKDNAWIESWFRILKHDWLKYKDYISFGQLERTVEQFINAYNKIRYHGAIGYVTPEQKHSGQAEVILACRTERRMLARQRRLQVNRNLNDQIQWPKAA